MRAWYARVCQRLMFIATMRVKVTECTPRKHSKMDYDLSRNYYGTRISVYFHSQTSLPPIITSPHTHLSAFNEVSVSKQERLFCHMCQRCEISARWDSNLRSLAWKHLSLPLPIQHCVKIINLMFIDFSHGALHGAHGQRVKKQGDTNRGKIHS